MNKIGLMLATCVLLSTNLSSASEVPGRGPTKDLALLDSAPLAPQQQQSYSHRQTDGNAVGFVVSNFGFFGNNFVTRAPSMEYPLGSDIEHLLRAGLWLGGVNAEGDTVVSTGCTSTSWVNSPAGNSEFTPRTAINERSTIITSDVFSEEAISEQDFIAEYTDYPKRGSNEGVLGVRIRQESYVWSHAVAEAFVIVDVTILNEGDDILDEVYIGILAELCSGWKGAYDGWPPPGSSWYRNKALEYFEDSRLCGEHHYNYQNGDAPSWGGIAFLGTSGAGVDSIGQLTVSFNWWDWYWERNNLRDDRTRYNMLKNGEIDATNGIAPREDDPVELISVGPFDHIAPGDSIVLVCAFLGGMDRQSLVDNTWWAQSAFDKDYVLPSVTVTSPNGGETWEKGTTYDIRWRAADDVEVASVSIVLSNDGGTTFPDTLAIGEENDGTFLWQIAERSTTTARIKVIAYDGDGNIGDDMSDGDFQIRRPMELSLGILQNPYLTQYLDVFLIGSRALDSASVELTVDEQAIAVRQIDREHDVWLGDCKLSEYDGAISLTGCASDTAGNDTCVTASFSSSLLYAELGGSILSLDGRVSMNIDPDVLLGNTYLILLPCKYDETGSQSGGNAYHMSSLRSLALDGMAPASYFIGPSAALGRGPAYLEFHYTDSDLGPEGTPGQLHIVQDGVGPLESYVDPANSTVGAKVSELGEFRLVRGPQATSKVADAGYLRLHPSSPNPFTFGTTVRFEIRAPQHIRAIVHDVTGRVVAHLLEESVYPGIHQVSWDGTSVSGSSAASGLYFIRVETEHSISSSKIVKLR